MERERHIMVMIDEQERIRSSSLLKIVPSSTGSGQREGKETKTCDDARILQLERTVKWWSESAACWREKWGRMKIQRDELREECRVLKGRNSGLIMEFQRLKNENDFLCCEIERIRPHKRIADIVPSAEGGTRENNNISAEGENASQPTRDSRRIELTKKTGVEEYCLQNETKSPSAINTDFSFPDFLEDIKFIEGLLTESTKDRLSLMPTSKYKTDHVMNAIITEKLSALKEYVTSCEKFLVLKESESTGLKSRLTMLESWKRRILKEYGDTKVTLASKPFTEEKNGGTTTDKSVRTLYAEIERLQQDNLNEWTKREQCETKMAELKRELRREQQDKKELAEQLTKKKEDYFASNAAGRKLLADELEAKCSEVTEVKTLCNKLRRQTQEKTDELMHEKKRAEYLDDEVKNLRLRIDELKEKVLTSEESVDLQENTIRRLQRSLEEQVDQAEVLQAELKHASLRLQRQSKIITCRSDDSISDESV